MPQKKSSNSNKGRRLLIPMPVGRSGKTIAFVPLGTRITKDNAKRVANQSPYFLKPKPSDAASHLREVLRRAGILFEKPMATFSGEKELFARGKFRSLRDGTYAQIKKSHITNPKKVAQQIMDIIVRMHELGVVHQHPHWQNFVVNKEQRVKMLDSKFLSRQVHNTNSKSSFMRNYADDIRTGAQTIAAVLYPEIMAGQFKANHAEAQKKLHEVMQQLIDAHKRFTNTFGVTHEDIEYWIEMPSKK